jgi:anti-sigma regulatory factor (Ser/Thr protein kinase)
MAKLELNFVFPAAHGPGGDARRRIREFVRGCDLTERDVQTVEFVASELICNAIDHGGGGGAREVEDLVGDVEVAVHVEVAEDSWTIAVSDQGGGDPETLRALMSPDELPDLEDERGRGIYLLAQMVDRLEIDRAGKGLRLSATCAKGREG